MRKKGSVKITFAESYSGTFNRDTCSGSKHDAAVPGSSVLAKDVNTTNKISIEVTEKGFIPIEINVKPVTENGGKE